MDKSLLLLLSILLPHALCQNASVVPSTPQVATTTPYTDTTITTTTAPLDVVHFYDGSGTIASSDYTPSGHAVAYSFVIHTVAPYVIKVKFVWLSLRNLSSCLNESLTVLDGEPGSGRGDPETLAVLCGTGRGSVPPHSLKSTGQSLTLVLNSTEPLQGRGFNISYLYVAATRTNQDCGVETGGWTNPWSAKLYLGANNPVCEAALISPQWLITTASCFNNRSLIPGDWLAQFNNNTSSGLVSIARHPKFNASTWDYDVALVRLLISFSPSDHIRPACLPHRLQLVPLPGKSCSVISSNSGYAIANRVSIMEQSECQVVFNATVTSRNLCASYNICGDHTSPLLCKEVDGRQYVTGVGGRGSCGPASLLNRVWRVLSFINQTTYGY
ncbi:transmembrane protease serine 9-like [Petromyzon marinus]|uniref:Transmembrane protease serine 9-like n=1 Tax=Petromyzon marinus TaxID=7757 RepID=A0AAJ7UIR6_PETMA|nr:transmembrane protease serine 9-like [Petromyzon marinus]XP_032835563.1 transmembrane protease serine 9-like [Petromyzon marinus]